MKEEETVLGVLMYLFHHHMHQNKPLDLTDRGLIKDLKASGFQAYIIGQALNWLQDLVALTDQSAKPSSLSFRVLVDQEREQLDDDCWNLIFSLEKQGILTRHAREIVIHQVLTLTTDEINLPLLTWVMLMVLFHMPDSEQKLAHMENLVLNYPLDTRH